MQMFRFHNRMLLRNHRLQSCETTFEHLERYSAMSQVNHTWIDATSETVSKMPPVENGVQAKAQLDSTAVLKRFSYF